jgi:hypothetical protein
MPPVSKDTEAEAKRKADEAEAKRKADEAEAKAEAEASDEPPRAIRCKIVIAGASYRKPDSRETVATQVAVRGEVVEVHPDDVDRLFALGAVEETDEPLSAVPVPLTAREHAQTRESQEEHAARVKASSR